MNNNLRFLFALGTMIVLPFTTYGGEGDLSSCLLEMTNAGGFSSCLVEMTTTKQQQTITGKVTFDGMPMTGVTVSVKGKTDTTVSGENGIYSISAAPTDVLIFSFIGFKTLEVAVNGRTLVDAQLQEDATALQEVTINAGYYNIKESERTGSIAKVTAKEIEKQPVANILGTMQGRMAGVNVTQETGMPGGGYNINIRGVNSLRTDGNAPLYVIDGVPYSSEGMSFAQTSTSIPGDGNPLSNINPRDVESVEILKDADATAIYGSRGANGVVLITTKKGKAGKTTFTVNATHATGKVTRFMDLMNTEQYLAMRRQAYANDHIVNYPSNAYDVNNKWEQHRYTDWQKELIGGTSEIMGWQASASGGTEQTQFLFSGNYRTETTVFPGDNLYKRGGAHLNLDHQSADRKFRLVFSGNYNVQHSDMPWIDFVSLSRRLAPNAPALYDENGHLNWQKNTWQNPLAQLEAKNLADTRDLVANAVVSYQLPHHFEMKANLGYTDLHNDESRTSPSTMANPAFNVGSESSSLFTNTYARRSWIVEPQLSWYGVVGKSKVDVLAGGTFQNQQSNRLAQVAYGFSSNSLIYDLTSAANLQVYNNDEVVYKYQAFFGRVNYSYDGKYIVNFTGRRDGSSRFGPGKQFATFGAVGAAWLLHKEAFLSGVTAVSFAKLRGSYGTTGNDQIGDYQFLDTYTASGYEYGGVRGLQPSRLYNADFGWESNTKMEAAAEFGFFKDRIFVTAAWYRNRSSNQLTGLPLPGTTGFTTIQSNLDATVQNSGLELTLRAVGIQRANFSWVANVNLTLPKNELISFPGLEYSAYKNDYVVGEPITIKKLFHYTGINPETGVYEFEDVNGDGVLSYADDRETVRDFAPEYYGGIQNQFTYKNFQLDFLFQFVKQLNWNYGNTQGYSGLLRNQPAAFADSWTGSGSNAQYQIFTTGTNQQAMKASEYYALSDASVSDASYIRLKNVSLSYQLPAKLLGGVQCRLSVEGQNLLTITSFEGADPEFRDTNTLPPLRVFSVGLNVSL